MKHLSVDLETYSSVPLPKAGAYRYIESPDFEILLFAYSADGGPVHCVDFACGEVLPPEIAHALIDPQVIKHAYNASFEWSCLSKYFGRQLPPEQWRCTMLHGMYAGYPAGLGAVGAALGLAEDKRKLATGRTLIKYFCVPCAPTQTNGERTRNRPWHDPAKWELFKQYCCGDVITEMAVKDKLANIPVPGSVQKQWETDLLINARGVAVDMALVSGARSISSTVTGELLDEAVAISGLSNPNSVQQLSAWLEEELEEDITDLRKATVAGLLQRDGNSANVQRMLEIRQELGKTSTKKYDAIDAAVCVDGRVRGLLQFYGANRTGRWAGRLVQVQNLPRTYTEPLDLARQLIKGDKREALELIYGSVPDTLSQLIRTAFVAPEGRVLIDADFSAIEARVISWLAKEEWKLEVFRTHGKIYEASASQMFGVPMELIKKGNPEYELRQRGKVAELALGYQGGVPAMRSMDSGGLLKNTSDDEVKDIIRRWRNANPRIRDLWYSIQNAAIYVVANGGIQHINGIGLTRVLDYDKGTDSLCITLPSGRTLFYCSPQITENRWGEPSISYLGVNDKNKWGRIETYGGKLVENIVQAVARDCLAEAVERLETAGLPVVFHVHDEVVIETAPFGSEEDMLRRVTEIMSVPPAWAPGLPLNADGWVGTYFKKD